MNPIQFYSKWVDFHFFCAMLYLCTILSLFTDCKVFPLHTNTSPWFPHQSRWAMSMHEILIPISIYILACMSVSQLIWWHCASLSSACTFLFVFHKCKIYLFYLWSIINLYSDCMFATKSDLIASHFLDNSLHSTLCLEHQPSPLRIQISQWL